MGWVILIAVLMLMWIAAMQPVWLRLIFAPGRAEIQFKYLGLRFRSLGTPSPKKPQKERERKKHSGKFSLQEWRAIMPRILRAIKRALAYLFRKIEVRRFDLQGEFGFDDPGITGVLYGAYCAAEPQINGLGNNVNVILKPNFIESQAQFSGVIETGMRPSSAINFMLILLWHLPKRRLIRAIRGNKP